MIAARDRIALRPEQATIPPGHPWARIPAISSIAAAVGIVASIGLGAGNPRQFFFSWLVAFLFFLSLALGALYYVLIQYATQGGWGIVLRRIAENTFATVPVLAVLFVPLLLGLHDVYTWTAPGAADHDALLQWKAPYLNLGFFLLRAAIYFACWSVIAVAWYRGSRSQDATGDLATSARLRRLTGPAIVVLGLTQTFASIDWIMSLTPHWSSTIFGVYFFAGALVGFLAFLTIVAVAMRRAGLLETIINTEHLHDVGKLLFGFTAFWAYIAFSQFLLVWYGNLPEETIWYKIRLDGSWRMVSLLLMVGHFLIPFFYLMGRAVKRNASTLLAGAAWLLLMHLVDIYWLVMPNLHPEGPRVTALDVAAFLAVGGCFAATAGWLMTRQALVPLRDPRISESLAFENV